MSSVPRLFKSSVGKLPSLMTWQLWRSFNRPPRHHPLFRYVVTHPKGESPKVASLFFMWMFLCSGFGFCWTVTFDWLPTLILLGLLFANTTYSLLWALKISRTIVDEQQQRRYDLLAALPTGKLGTSWAMSMGCLHRQASFTWIPFFVRLFTTIGFFTLVGALSVTLFILNNAELSEASYNANYDIIPLMVAGIGLVILFYIDHLYSVVTAILLGMIAPIDIRNRSEALMRTLAGFLLVQLPTYLFCWLIVVTLLPPVLASMGIDIVSATIIETVLAIVLFIALREATTRWLWYYLMRQLNVSHDEIERIVFVF